ncbi:MAG: hypothetical protein A2351_04520 [Omnitrophica bacterium RIFOXYB12_FULL_50_7]|nr:MAG: hypothetical protein A2351_04520 [Omnitrophica bacterium RIFOXYB12_FULL_50_7]
MWTLFLEKIRNQRNSQKTRSKQIPISKIQRKKYAPVFFVWILIFENCLVLVSWFLFICVLLQFFNREGPGPACRQAGRFLNPPQSPFAKGGNNRSNALIS